MPLREWATETKTTEATGRRIKKMSDNERRKRDETQLPQLSNPHKSKKQKDMKAIRYIRQALRRMATALLTVLFGAILWAGALIFGVAGEIIAGVVRTAFSVVITLLSIATFFALIIWLLTI